MYYLLTLLTGFVIAVMVAVNGKLTDRYDVFIAAIIIHIVGAVFAYLICKVTKKKIRLKREYPIWFYLGGAIGVLTTFFNNFAFGKISMTSIVALGLFGQMVASFIIDSFGLLGMKKYPLKKSAILGSVFSFAGVFVMLDGSVGTALYAVIFSFCAGITNVLSRTVNAKLSEKIGELESSFMNHIVGLPITIVVALAFGNIAHFKFSYVSPAEWWIYFGGTLGVCTVLLYNIIVPKLSAFHVTLLIFISQVFSGIGIDIIMQNEYFKTSLAGGIMVALGVLFSTIYKK